MGSHCSGGTSYVERASRGGKGRPRSEILIWDPGFRCEIL